MLAKQAYTFGMNKLSVEERAKIVGCLVEGNSIRATVRLTGASKNTVAKLLVDLGRAHGIPRQGFSESEMPADSMR